MAAMTSIIISFTTTTKTTDSIAPFTSSSSSSSSSSYSTFNYLKTGGRTSKLMKQIDRFPLRSSQIDSSNSILSSNISENDVSNSVTYSLDSASDIVTRFYGGINSRDLSTVVDLIAEDCVYEDLVFPQPFVGRKAILEFFETFIYTISQDLQFVIDDISGEDTSAVGVTWHLEWKGKPFPFSKGCSFYRLQVVDGQRKIMYSVKTILYALIAKFNYGRDVVEPAVKPGDFALVAIRGVTWLLQQFPQLAERF